MDSFKDIGFDLQERLYELHTKRSADKCGKCGQEIKWTGKCWRQNCPVCGSVLIKSSELPKKETECWICTDTGIVEYEIYIDGIVGHCGSACTCQKGQQFVNSLIPRIDNAMFAPPITAIISRNKEICKA